MNTKLKKHIQHRIKLILGSSLHTNPQAFGRAALFIPITAVGRFFPKSIIYWPKTTKFIYIGLTGSYINHQDQFNQDYFRKASDHKQYALEQADYRRIKTTLSMHLGSVLFMGKNWGFSPYISWGVKNPDVKFSHIQGMRPVTREDTHNFIPSATYYLRREGSSTGVQLELRLAVFFKL